MENMHTDVRVYRVKSVVSSSLTPLIMYAAELR